MKVAKRVIVLGIGVFLFAALAGLRAWAEEYSHARIVRLSFTEGTVTVQSCRFWCMYGWEILAWPIL